VGHNRFDAGFEEIRALKRWNNDRTKWAGLRPGRQDREGWIGHGPSHLRIVSMIVLRFNTIKRDSSRFSVGRSAISSGGNLNLNWDNFILGHYFLAMQKYKLSL
jgi:hypothetical protein